MTLSCLPFCAACLCLCFILDGRGTPVRRRGQTPRRGVPAQRTAEAAAICRAAGKEWFVRTNVGTHTGTGIATVLLQKRPVKCSHTYIHVHWHKCELKMVTNGNAQMEMHKWTGTNENTQMEMHICTNAKSKWTNGESVNSQMRKCANVQMLKCANAQRHQCQMLFPTLLFACIHGWHTHLQCSQFVTVPAKAPVNCRHIAPMRNSIPRPGFQQLCLCMPQIQCIRSGLFQD